MITNPFSPIGDTVNVSASTSSGSVALTSPGNSGSVAVYNSASGIAFVNFGTSTVTASTSTSVPIAPGSTRLFALSSAQTHAAAILSTGTGTVYFTTGQGV